jgi:uncharacterized protein YqhQ
VERCPAKPKAGGQAVIEGVMIRSGAKSAVAVRTPGGAIRAGFIGTKPLGGGRDIWKKPVFRGAASLIDSLRIGLSALNWSADEAEPRDPGKKSGGFQSFMATALGLLLALVLFAWLPLRLALLILPGGRESLWINLLAGGFRVTAFFAYVASISLMPAMRRVFVYHGAEHQTLHAWEKGGEPLQEASLAESPLHPRCGTSFLLLVIVLGILFYAIVDTAATAVLGIPPAAHWRVLYHLPLLPLVMGLGYEVLRLADRHLETSALARAVSAPGMLLQRMTTRRAGREELEVAAAALMLATGGDPGAGVEVMEEPVG